ncbi:hypothetical protein M0812_05253 [Anaeramoeba flamelloides]|uniref:Transmembrane protein n=1 Tax=Anaeramoeba flamelloides TaxID=1746091 RepID=A0AAV8AA73_9EUKA|nr:hypothetical protein M0812_05253 [Anaeramoeba flamelloides]
MSYEKKTSKIIMIKKFTSVMLIMAVYTIVLISISIILTILSLILNNDYIQCSSEVSNEMGCLELFVLGYCLLISFRINTNEDAEMDEDISLEEDTNQDKSEDSTSAHSTSSISSKYSSN